MFSNLRKLRWFVLGRIRLRKAIAGAASQGKLKVILGASITHYDGWISTDLPHFNILDNAHWKYLFQHHRADNLLAEHVFEHLTSDQVKTALQCCHQWLKPGGCLRIAVPDANHPDPHYLRLTLPPADDHLSSWSFDSLSDLLGQCGFRAVPLEFYSGNKQLSTFEFDSENGPVSRSIQKGFVNQNIKGYSSLIVDAINLTG